ncbi:MAG: hypothetical protein E7013_05320 [Alphaproteobacteria bacterium]|nr:hypothetical protein [Alphaproteobacteria bacterium]
MITFFRNFGETWFAKALLFLFAISMMGLFGLGSMTAMWGKEQDAILVGNSAVKGIELVRDTQAQMQKLSAMSGNTATFDVNFAYKNGLVEKLIQNKVANLVYQYVQDDLDLVASDQAIANYIVNNANFKNISGNFDRAYLIAYLQNMRMSEQEFTAALEEELSRKHLSDAIKGILAVPSEMKNKIYAYSYETRDMDLLLLPTNVVKIDTTPDKETLQVYYESMQDKFYAPEYRSISVIKLTPEMVMADIDVDEAALKQMYEEKKELYSKPERRRIEQILLKDVAQADSLVKELNADNFAQLAKEKALQEDIDLGFVEKAGVVEEIGDVVFDAPLNQVLGPVASPFGYHILIVREIQKAEQTPFEAVKDELKKTLQAEQAYDVLYQKSAQLENALMEGADLNTVAQNNGMILEKFDAIDISGSNKDAKTVGLPQEFVQKLFLMNVGDVTPLFDFENGFIVGQVDGIEPIYLKPIEAVEAELKEEWLKDEQKKNAKDFADRVLTALKSGSSFDVVSSMYNLQRKNLDAVKRSDIADMSSDVVDRLYSAQVSDIELIDMGQGDYVIAQISKITPADKEDVAALTVLEMNLKDKMLLSAVDEVLDYYTQKQKVKINQNVIEEAFAPYIVREE